VCPFSLLKNLRAKNTLATDAKGLRTLLNYVIAPLALIWAGADPSVATQLSLEESLRQAVGAQPMLQASVSRAQQAQGQLTEARSIYFPQLNFSAQVLEGTVNGSPASYVSWSDLARVGSGQRDANRQQGALSTLMGFGAHYDLLDFGYASATVRAAQDNAAAAHSSAQQALQDTLLRVAQAYFKAVAARDSLEVAKHSESRAQAHHAMAQAGVRSGLKPRIDLARADAELARAHLSVLRADRDRQISLAALQTAIGWRPRELELSDVLSVDSLPIPVEQALHLALQNRPDLAAATARTHVAQQFIKVATAGHFPKISATGSANLRGFEQAPKTFNWDVGLVLSLPVFSGFLVEGQRQEARAVMAAQQAEQTVLADAIWYQISEAHSSLIAAQFSVPAAEKQVAAAHDNLEQAEARYKEGLGNIVELADAQTQYATAQFESVESYLNFALSDVQFKYAYAGLISPDGEKNSW
jgi:outer membrane protein